MANTGEELEELRIAFVQNTGSGICWLNLAKANMSKAIIGQVYALNLQDEQMPSHNGTAFIGALLAGTEAVISILAAQNAAARTRRLAAELGLPTPEWADNNQPIDE